MDSCHRFNETSLPNEKEFYSNLNMDGIADSHFKHANESLERFLIKNLSDYHHLYVQNDMLLLADVFESFRNKCIEIYELDPAHFLSAPGLAWQPCLKMNEIKLKLLTDIDMLEMAENESEVEYVTQFIDMQRQIKIYERLQSKHLMYWDSNDLYEGGTVSEITCK